MRDIPTTPDVPVIFLSAYGGDQIISRAFEMGTVKYVVKPFSPTELVAKSGRSSASNLGRVRQARKNPMC